MKDKSALFHITSIGGISFLMKDFKTIQPSCPPEDKILIAKEMTNSFNDINNALKGMNDGAPGPDDRTLNDLKDVPGAELAAHFNLWWLAGYLPAALCHGETVLIPKESGTQDPGKHHPITLLDITIRCFHRVLAKRTKKDLPWNTHQKAFRSGDGVADSIWLLQNIIRQHQHTYKPFEHRVP
ncbi:hypothetical protein ACROYT_G015531 [Oculina patagonica]